VRCEVVTTVAAKTAVVWNVMAYNYQLLEELATPSIYLLYPVDGGSRFL
jgi:hypothetical protein